MQGTVVELEVDSAALAGNPLGDPARRLVLAYLPPAHGGAPLPSVTFLHGFAGTARGWTSASVFAPTVPERLDALVASGEIPPVVGVFPDGATALGGTQWTNAPAVGRYQDYVAEDVRAAVEARLGTLARREARAVVGKSSGGYGALCLGRDRPDVFALVGAHAPDCCFEYCYLPDLPKTAAALLSAPDPAAWLDGARLREGVWARWLEHDPVRFVPRTAGAFRRLAGVFLDCGTRDEFNLRWGTRMVAEALRSAGVAVEHQEFDDGHGGTSY